MEKILTQLSWKRKFNCESQMGHTGRVLGCNNICVLGGACVGKSSLVRKLCLPSFDPSKDEVAPSRIEKSVYTLFSSDTDFFQNVYFFFDTPGITKENEDGVMRYCFPNIVNCFLILFAVDDERESVNQLPQLLRVVYRYERLSGLQNVPVIFCGAKGDQVNEKTIQGIMKTSEKLWEHCESENRSKLGLMREEYKVKFFQKRRDVYFCVSSARTSQGLDGLKKVLLTDVDLSLTPNENPFVFHDLLSYHYIDEEKINLNLLDRDLRLALSFVGPSLGIRHESPILKEVVTKCGKKLTPQLYALHLGDLFYQCSLLFCMIQNYRIENDSVHTQKKLTALFDSIFPQNLKEMCNVFLESEFLVDDNDVNVAEDSHYSALNYLGRFWSNILSFGIKYFSQTELEGLINRLEQEKKLEMYLKEGFFDLLLNVPKPNLDIARYCWVKGGDMAAKKNNGETVLFKIIQKFMQSGEVSYGLLRMILQPVLLKGNFLIILNHTDDVMQFIERFVVDVNAKNINNGDTFVHLLCKMHSTPRKKQVQKMINELMLYLQRNYDFTAENNEGKTAISYLDQPLKSLVESVANLAQIKKMQSLQKMKFDVRREKVESSRFFLVKGKLYEELIQTEIEFVHALEELWENYFVELEIFFDSVKDFNSFRSKMNVANVQDPEIQSFRSTGIFSLYHSLKVIKQASISLIKNIQQILRGKNLFCLDVNVEEKILLRLRSYGKREFGSFIKYVNQDLDLENKYLKKYLSKVGLISEFKDYTSRPMQRVTRIPLVLSQILKVYGKYKSVASSHLKSLITDIWMLFRERAKECNFKRYISELSNTKNEPIQKFFQKKYSMNMFSTRRSLVFDGEFKCCSSSTVDGLKSLRIVIFNNAIFLCFDKKRKVQYLRGGKGTMAMCSIETTKQHISSESQKKIFLLLFGIHNHRYFYLKFQSTRVDVVFVLRIEKSHDEDVDFLFTSKVREYIYKSISEDSFVYAAVDDKPGSVRFNSLSIRKLRFVEENGNEKLRHIPQPERLVFTLSDVYASFNNNPKTKKSQNEEEEEFKPPDEIEIEEERKVLSRLLDKYSFIHVVDFQERRPHNVIAALCACLAGHDPTYKNMDGEYLRTSIYHFLAYKIRRDHAFELGNGFRVNHLVDLLQEKDILKEITVNEQKGGLILLIVAASVFKKRIVVMFPNPDLPFRIISPQDYDNTVFLACFEKARYYVPLSW